MNRLVLLLGIICATTSGFVVAPCRRPSTSQLLANKKNDFEAALAALVVGAALVFNPQPTVAAASMMTQTNQNPAIAYSSLTLAADIKVLDMSLPSYGAISAPKADLESLAVVPTRSDPAIITKKEKVVASSKKTTKKIAVEKQQKGDDDDKGSTLTIVDMKMPSYGDSQVGKGKEAFSF